MRNNLKDYWIELQTLLTQYDQHFQHITPRNEADLDSYNGARDSMEVMIEIGLKLESSLWPPTKIELGKKLDKMSEDQFKMGELPAIPGPKSFSFSQEVLLPALKKSLAIEHGKIAKLISKKAGIDIEERMNKAAYLVEKLELRINEYAKCDSPLIKQSLFSETNKDLRSDVKEDITTENSLRI